MNDKGRYRRERLMMKIFVQSLGRTALYLPDLIDGAEPGTVPNHGHPGSVHGSEVFGAGCTSVERRRLAESIGPCSPGHGFRSPGRRKNGILASAGAHRSGVGRGDSGVEPQDGVLLRFGLRLCIAVYGGRKAVHSLEHAAQLPAAGSGQSGSWSDRLAYLAPYLSRLARRQRRTAHRAEGAHAARIDPDYAEYVWWRNDGLDAGSARAGSEAGDRALMDASGRQRES